MKINLAQIMCRILGLWLAAAFALTDASSLKAANSTWTDFSGSTSSTGWNTAGNWSPSGVPWLSGGGGYTNALVFPAGITGAGLINGNDMTGATISGLTFNPGAGAYTLGGNSLTTLAGFTDDANSLETINFPIGFGSTGHSINVISGGSLTVNNVISGTSATLAKTGGGLLTLTGEAAGANTFGPTAVNAGSLLLDFSQGGSTPGINIVPNAALTLSGGTLIVNGSASGANSQSFASTTFPAAATTSPGQNIVTAINGVSGGTATINLAGITLNTGSSVVFDGPATIVRGNATLAASGTITTGTAGSSASPGYGVLVGGNNNNAYATVGFYDWASTDTAGGGAGSSPYTILGGSQVSGFYDLLGNNANSPSTTTSSPYNFDFTTQQTPAFGGSSNVRFSTTGTQPFATIRYNSPIAPYATVKSGNYIEVGGILVSPNMGYINAGLDLVRLAGTTTQIVQNNTAAAFCLGVNGVGAIFANDSNTGEACVKSGAGTLFLNPGTPMHIAFNYTNSSGALATSSSTYYDSAQAGSSTWGAFYLNGGVTVINNANVFGNPTTQTSAAGGGGTVNLNGGTLLAASTTANAGSVRLINAAVTGTTNRPVFLGGNGGGLAAQSATTFAVGGVISGALGTGPLTIGIPASSANNNTVGLVPGTGPGTANSAINATGTVILTNANTYYGGTLLQSGLLNLNGINALGGADYGGVTFNGGTLQYATAFSGNGSGDLTSIGTAGVTLAAGGGTIDVNGNAVSFAGSIGNSGSGTLTVMNSTPTTGSLTLNSANTYTNTTTVGSGRLALGASGSLDSQNISVSTGAVFDVSAQSFTLAAGQALSGSGVVTGNVATASSALVVPGTLAGGIGTLSFSNSLTLLSGETNYFNLSSSPSGSNDKVIVAGTLTLPASGQSVITINFTASPGAGTYKLFSYGTLAGGSLSANLVTNFTGFSIGTLVASLSSSTPGEIDLVLSNPRVPTIDTWVGDGVNNYWDTATTNWINNGTSALTNFFNFDSVVFSDNGSATPAVNLQTVLSPTAVLVDTTINSYTFNGNGQIAAGTLTLEGSTTLTLLTTNSLPGPIVIQGGTLQVGNGTSSGAIGLGNVANNATLWMDSPATVATGPIIGTGNVAVQAGGTLTIGGNSTLSVLTLGSSDGSDTTGTLDLSGYSLTATNLTLGTDASGGTIGSSSSSANATLYYTGTGSTYAGVIQDALGSGSKTVALNLAAASTLTLDNANNYSGGTIISNGAYLTLTGAGSLGSGLVTLYGGTLYQNGDFVANTFSNAPAATSTMIYADGTTYYPTLNVLGAGVLNLTINGAGVFTPGGSWSGFSGTVNVSGAYIRSSQVTAASTYGSATATWNLGATGGFFSKYGNQTVFLGALNGVGGSSLSSGNTAGGGITTYVVGSLGSSSSFGGVISDNVEQTSLRKVGAGLLVLTNLNTYTGPTIVSNGTLEVDGSLAATPTTNYPGATLVGLGTLGGMVVLLPGSAMAPGMAGTGNYGTLTCTGGLVNNGGTNRFKVSTTNTDLVAVTGGLYLNGGTVMLNIYGTLTNGNYPLFSYDTLSGFVGSLALVPATLGTKSLSLAAIGGSIYLVVAPTGTQNLVWASLAEGAANNNWDIEIDQNWLNGAALDIFDNGDTVNFNNSGAANSPVNIPGAMQPASVVVSGNQPYEFSGAGKISGSTQLIISNYSSTLTLDTFNDYSGATVINSGTIQVGDGTTIGTSIGAGPVTNNSALVFAQPDTNSLDSITGTGSLTLVGGGRTIVTGNATYTGTTLINSNSTLEFGSGNATAVPPTPFTVTNNATVGFNLSGTLLLTNGITGPGALSLDGPATVTLAGTNNTYLENTYVHNGTLKLGTNNIIPNANNVAGSTGWLILDGGTTAGTVDLNGFNQTVNALSGLTGTVLGLTTNSAASGTNVLTINTIATETPGYAGVIADNTNSGRIALVVNGPGVQTLSGASAYSGGTTVHYPATLNVGLASSLGTGLITLIGGTLEAVSGVQLNGDSLTVPAGTNGTVNMPANLMKLPALYGSGTLAINVSNTVASSSSAAYGNAFGFCANFSGTLNITGAVASALMVMNFNNGSGYSFDGNLSSATVNLYDGVSLVGLNNSGGNVAQFGALNVDSASSLGGGYVTGGGTQTYQIGALNTTSDLAGSIVDGPNSRSAITKVGTGTLILDNSGDSYTGNTTVNAGTLMVGASGDITASPMTVATNGTLAGTGTVAANVTVNGTLAPGTPTTTGTLTCSGNVTNNATATNVMKLDLNNTLNDLLSVGNIFYGGTLQVVLLNATPTVGATFQLYNAGSESGSFSAIVGSDGVAYTFNAASGVLTVASVTVENPLPGNLIASFNGTTLSLAWPTNALWTLEAQTNGLSAGLRNNWVPVSGSTSITNLSITVDRNQPTVFYRLKY